MRYLLLGIGTILSLLGALWLLQGLGIVTIDKQGWIADFMNSIEKVVFSRTLKTADWNNTKLFNGNVAEEVSKLKEKDGGDIFVFGSADLTATLMQHDLIDEYHLGINPVILGSGTPLFKEGPNRKTLKHLETRTLKSGVVILHYAPESI